MTKKLRKIDSVRYELKIDELDKTISYRALKAGETKRLLEATEMGSPADIVNTTFDILRESTFGTIDPDTTPLHIMDYIFLKTHIKTNGALAPVVFTCGGLYTDEENNTSPCDVKMNLQINLENAIIDYNDGWKADTVIKVDDTCEIRMTPPSATVLRSLDAEGGWQKNTGAYIAAAIKEIVIDGETINASEIADDELSEWIDDLDTSILLECAEYIKGIPDLIMPVDVTCPKCGRKEGFILRGLADFFQ